jgi:hypothetical protein
VKFSQPFRYKIMLSANRGSLISSFPIYIPFGLVTNSKNMFNNIEVVDTFVSFLTLEEMISVFSPFGIFSMMLDIDLSYTTCIMLRSILLFLLSSQPSLSAS